MINRSVLKPSMLSVLCLCFLYQIPHAAIEDGISVNFSAVAWNQTIRDLVYFDNQSPRKILVANGAPGERFSYRGPSALTFYSEGTNPEGETVYRPRVSVDIPPGHRDLLLIFITDGSEDSLEGNLRILAVPDNRESFGAGCFNFINLTPNHIAVRLSGQLLNLAPGSGEIIQAPSDQPQNVNVQIAASSGRDDWRLVYQSRWGPPGNRRIWVFLHGDKDNRPSLKRYYEYSR